MERCDRNRIMEMNIRDQINNYYYLLKHYSEYENKEEMLKFFFKKKNDKNLSELYITYKLERFAKVENEKQLFAKVLAWTYENLNYKQNKEFVQEETAINILQFSKQNKSGVNCRNHAIVLTCREQFIPHLYRWRDELRFTRHLLTSEVCGIIIQL